MSIIGVGQRAFLAVFLRIENDLDFFFNLKFYSVNLWN